MRGRKRWLAYGTTAPVTLLFLDFEPKTQLVCNFYSVCFRSPGEFACPVDRRISFKCTQQPVMIDSLSWCHDGRTSQPSISLEAMTSADTVVESFCAQSHNEVPDTGQNQIHFNGAA